jgi:putative MATE family efflux protein
MRRFTASFRGTTPSMSAPVANHNDPLLHGNLLRGLLRLATPMLAGALLQNLQSVIDLFWVGRLGPEALAAVALGATVIMVLFPVLMGLSVGTTALVARAVGAGRYPEAGAAAAQSLLLAVILSVVCGLVGAALATPLLDLLGAEPEVLRTGSVYLRVFLFGATTLFVLFIGTAALQGAGDALTPMLIMGVANVLNLVLDPLFIFGLGPLPGLGVAGAALATVVAQAVAAALAVALLLSGRVRLHLRARQFRPDPALAWRILRIGIPGSGQMLSRSLMSLVLMHIVARCGTAAVAAYGTGLRLHMIVLMPAFALGGAAGTMVGQNLGAGQPGRARRAAWLATGIDLLFMLLAALVLALAAPGLIRVFNAEPEVVAIGADYLRTVSPFYVFAALAIVLGRALNGAGDSLGPMLFTVVSLWGLQVPLALHGSRHWASPTRGIWWAIVAATVLHGVLMAVWFEMGRWKRARV